jgi:ParB-like chromosome segregation protein Spo0J
MFDLPVSRIFMRADARKIDDGAVTGLMESIKELGIINPLRVRAARKMVDGVEADAYEVIAGGHRLRAASKLGLETVPCIVVDDDELHVELAMIDENLCRADLTPAERARATGRRKLIYEKLHPETVHGAIHEPSGQFGDTVGGAERFTAETAKVTGKSERAIQRDAERGDRIAPDVIDKIRGTHLDTGVYLDSLKKIGPNEQRNKVLRDLAKPKSVKRAAAAKSDDETEEEWMAAIMRIWNRGAKKWRERFLEAVDTAVMDAA